MFKFGKSSESNIKSPETIITIADREKALRAIMYSSAGSFSMEDVIRSIIEETGRLFKADRCFFVEWDSKNSMNLPIKDYAEYLSSSGIKSHLSRQAKAMETKAFMNFTDKKKIRFVENTEKIQLPETTRRMLIDDLSVKSYLSMPIFFGDIMYGAIVLHYVNDFMQIREEYIEVAQAIAIQSAIVIHQAKTYNELKQTLSEQNAILKNMPFMAWTKDIEGKYMSVNNEFCKNYKLDIEDILGKTDYMISPIELAEKYRKDDLEVIQTGKQKITEEEILNGNTLGWAETYKSPFYDADENISGTVGMARDITERKQAELELINQHEKIINAAERERVIANIMSNIVNNFEFSQLTQIISDVIKITKADRCYFAHAPNLGDKEIAPLDYEEEYLSSTDIKSIKGYNFSRGAIEQYVEAFLQTKDIAIFDYDSIKQEQNINEEELIKYAELFNIKSGISIPFFYMGKLKAVIVIEYMKEKITLSEEDLNFLKILANQAGLAFNQVLLYQDTKNAAQREKLIREIISEVSSTLDSNEIRKTLVNKLGCALNSDLDIIYVWNPKNKKFLPVDKYSVHLASKEIESPIDKNIMEDYGWNKHVLKNKKAEIIYSDIKKLKEDYELKGTKAEEFIDKYKIKSLVAIPIVYAKTFLGILVLNFIKEERKFHEDDINLVRIVASQAAIALYQSNLYLKSQEASRAKSEFIANMSHEIKTPLNIIIGFSEILSQSKLSPSKQANYLNNINMSGKHLLNLTNDIINISKIESGSFELNYENCNSEAIINEAVESIKLIAEGKQIFIEVVAVQANVVADKKMLTQILYNLLTNAIKFTPDMGIIKINSEIKNNSLKVTIEDTGIGIDENDQNIIFEKFKQVDSSLEKVQQGAGLGLAITKELVELHNGSIHVESTKGLGSRFWFVLPNASKVE